MHVISNLSVISFVDQKAARQYLPVSGLEGSLADMRRTKPGSLVMPHDLLRVSGGPTPKVLDSRRVGKCSAGLLRAARFLVSFREAQAKPEGCAVASKLVYLVDVL